VNGTAVGCGGVGVVKVGKCEGSELMVVGNRVETTSHKPQQNQGNMELGFATSRDRDID